MNKKISNMQRFLTLLFTDKDLGEELSDGEKEIIPVEPGKKDIKKSKEEHTVQIHPEDV